MLKTAPAPQIDDRETIARLENKIGAPEVVVLLLTSRLQAVEACLGAPAPVDLGYVSIVTAAARLRLTRQRISQLCSEDKLASAVFCWAPPRQ
jgi:hypothetical protein